MHKRCMCLMRRKWLVRKAELKARPKAELKARPKAE